MGNEVDSCFNDRCSPLFVITQGKALKETKDVPPDAECLLCVDDIMEAIEHCTNATTPNPTMECIEYALGAASDCIRCICDIIDIIDGGDNPVQLTRTVYIVII